MIRPNHPGLLDAEDPTHDSREVDAFRRAMLVDQLGALIPVRRRTNPGSAASARQSDRTDRRSGSQPSPEESLGGDPSFAGLTEMEYLVLLWISEGKRNHEIATILGNSPRTVEKHVAKVLKKLAVETRGAAARVLTDFHTAKQLAIPDAGAMTKLLKCRSGSEAC